MTTGEVTFGQTISKARKAKSLSQKDLAGIILKEEDGTPISPQYLNDIEHDRRSPTSDHLIRGFAEALGVDEDLVSAVLSASAGDAAAASATAARAVATPVVSAPSTLPDIPELDSQPLRADEVDENLVSDFFTGATAAPAPDAAPMPALPAQVILDRVE